MAWLPFSSKRIPVSVLTKDYSSAIAAKKQLVFLHGSFAAHADVFTTVGSDSSKLVITEGNGTSYVLHTVVEWNYTGTPATSYGVVVLNRPIQHAAAEQLYLYYGISAGGSILFSENFSALDTTNVWSENDPNNVLSVVDEKLVFSSSASSAASVTLTTRNKVLVGDFDVQIDFTISTLATGNSFTPRMVVQGTGINFGVAYQSGGVGVYAYQASETGQSDAFYLASGIASGKLRITRVGGTLRAYIWNGTLSRWEWNGSTAGRAFVAANSENLYLQILYYKGSAGTMIASSDNLVAYGTSDFKDANTLALQHPFRVVTENPVAFREVDESNPNPSMWNEVDAASRLTVQSAAVQFLSSSAAAENGAIYHYAHLTGDFDIRVDFACPTFTCSNSFGTRFALIDTVNGANAWRLHYQSGTINNYYYAIESTSDTPNIYSTTHKSGKLRWVRSGSTLTGYMWNSSLSRWEWNGNTAGRTLTLTSANDLYLHLLCTKAADGALTVTWANLSRQAGNYSNISDQQLGMYTYGSVWGGSPAFSSAAPGGGVVLNGSNWFTLGKIANFTSEAFSITCTVNASTLIGSPVLFANGAASTAGYLCRINSDGSITFSTSQSGASQSTSSTTGAITPGAPHAVTITRTGAVVKIHVNGGDVTSSSGSHVNPVASSLALEFGRSKVPDSYLTGVVGGISIHTEVKSADWIKAEHYSLLNTAFSWGSVENAPSLAAVFAGQSNCWNFFYSGYQGTEPDPGASARLFDSGMAFKSVTGDGARRLATTILNDGNIGSITLIHHSQGGTGLDPAAHNNIGYWLDTSAGSNYDTLKAIVAASGVTPKYFVWIQGETDADWNISKTAYKTDLGTLWLRVKADLGCDVMLVWGLGRTFSSGITDAATEDIRAAQREFAAENADVHLAGDTATFTLQDFIHYDNASRLRHGELTAECLLTLEGYAGGYSGPEITGANLVNNTTIDVSISHTLGTDFTPAANISGFFVDGVEVPAQRLDATTIRLTGSGFNPSSVVKYLYGTYCSKQISGTITSGTTTRATSTTTNFVAAGAFAGDQFYNTAQANYSAKISSITTTTNANDSLNMVSAAPLVNAAGNGYRVMANRFVFDDQGYPLRWENSITLSGTAGASTMFGGTVILGKDLFGGLTR